MLGTELVLYGVVLYGIVRCGIVWYGKVWYYMVWYCKGMSGGGLRQRTNSLVPPNIVTTQKSQYFLLSITIGKDRKEKVLFLAAQQIKIKHILNDTFMYLILHTFKKLKKKVQYLLGTTLHCIVNSGSL